MNHGAELAMRAVAIGIGATALLDLWGVIQRRFLGVAPLSMRMLGRWTGGLARGRFVHRSIAASEPVRGELPLGWGAHYAIGIAFAFLLVAVWGVTWARNPTLAPALIIGIGTIAAPLFILQPGMGLGIAASKAPRPWIARLRSLATHTVFGFGLYLSARLLALLI